MGVDCLSVGYFVTWYFSVCQIFWELKGGQVNYGREHAEEFGHDCLGEVHKQGSYPEV